MSYILDALKISEQSRQQAANASRPSLLPPVVDVEPEPGRPWAAYLTVAALILNGVVIVTMLRAPATDIAEAPVPNAVAAPGAPAAPIAEAAPAAPPTIAEDPAPPPPPTRPPRTETAHRPTTAAPVAAVAPASPPAPATVAAAAEPPAPPDKLALADKPEARAEAPRPADGVPANIQKQVPPLNIAGIIQDDDHNDLVMINDKLLREGDEAAPGLKVEKILADGVLFSFKGYRFKR